MFLFLLKKNSKWLSKQLFGFTLLLKLFLMKLRKYFKSRAYFHVKIKMVDENILGKIKTNFKTSILKTNSPTTQLEIGSKNSKFCVNSTASRGQLRNKGPQDLKNAFQPPKMSKNGHKKKEKWWKIVF